MKTMKVWKVMHHQDEHGGRFMVRFVATEKAAREMALQPWSFCGGSGEAQEIELKIYESVEEVTNESR